MNADVHDVLCGHSQVGCHFIIDSRSEGGGGGTIDGLLILCVREGERVTGWTLFTAIGGGYLIIGQGRGGGEGK